MSQLIIQLHKARALAKFTPACLKMQT